VALSEAYPSLLVRCRAAWSAARAWLFGGSSQGRPLTFPPAAEDRSIMRLHHDDREVRTAPRELGSLGRSLAVSLLVAAEVFGCTHGIPESPSSEGGQGGGGLAGAPTTKGGSAPGGTGGDSEWGVGGDPETAGAAGAATEITYPRACSDIYAPELVPEFELEIAPDILAAIEQDCATEQKIYRPAIFHYGDEAVKVMVRLKGNWSFRCSKQQFTISFNEVDSKARFHGLRKIVLDAPWYDPSLLAERLGFAFKRRAGSFWSCVNNARLSINGVYYGAYSNVERLDKEYLQRQFPGDDAEGNLYQGGVELTTNESVADTSRRDDLMAATAVSEIAAMTDLDEVVQDWASSAMLPDPDSYWAGVEANYYLYDHPKRGFLWLPVDLDLTMRQGVMSPATSSVLVGVQQEFVSADPFTYENPDWKREDLYTVVLSEPRWCERFLEALRAARDAYDVDVMSRDLDEWAAQIEDAVAEDPHRPYSLENHRAGVATLKEFMPQRLAYVDRWLETASCPVNQWP
jgi:hypothetical protein